jgi:hypothetical protein
MNILPDNLPNVGRARLPDTYKNAVAALERCMKVDECQKWAKKAEALASYAKQANDMALRKMADRIQARAIRRCGELLAQIKPARGDGRPSGGPVGRAATAKAAGMSEHQRKTAFRVAAVPKPEFDAAVESENPPTVTSLAKRGTVTFGLPEGYLGSRTPEQHQEATKLLGVINHVIAGRLP